MSLIIRPTLAALARFDNKPGLVGGNAEVLLAAIAIQESGLMARRQIAGGGARSLWQIEPPTAGDVLVRWKPARDLWNALCWPEDGLNIVTGQSFLGTLQYNDIAACAIARGILRLHPGPLPAVGERDNAWDYYLASWRPGKPGPERWSNAYGLAMDAVQQ